jgi:hypothetical protein
MLKKESHGGQWQAKTSDLRDVLDRLMMFMIFHVFFVVLVETA